MIEVTIHIPALDRLATALESHLGGASLPSAAAVTGVSDAPAPKPPKTAKPKKPTKKRIEEVSDLARKLVGLTDTKTLAAVNEAAGVAKVSASETVEELAKVEAGLLAAIATAEESAPATDEGI